MVRYTALFIWWVALEFARRNVHTQKKVNYYEYEYNNKIAPGGRVALFATHAVGPADSSSSESCQIGTGNRELLLRFSFANDPGLDIDAVDPHVPYVGHKSVHLVLLPTE